MDANKFSDLERAVFELKLAAKEREDEVSELLPLVPGFARLQGSYEGITRELGHLRDSIGAVRSSIEDRDRIASDERKAVRVALIALIGVITASVIGSLATLAASGVIG